MAVSSVFHDVVFHDAVSHDVVFRVASPAVSCDHLYDEAFSYPSAKIFSCRERYSQDSPGAHSPVSVPRTVYRIVLRSSIMYHP